MQVPSQGLLGWRSIRGPWEGRGGGTFNPGGKKVVPVFFLPCFLGAFFLCCTHSFSFPFISGIPSFLLMQKACMKQMSIGIFACFGYVSFFLNSLKTKKQPTNIHAITVASIATLHHILPVPLFSRPQVRGKTNHPSC